MGDAGAMRHIERRHDIDRHAQRLCRREGAPFEAVGQRLALEQLHDEERRAVVFANVVQRADVGVGQLGDRARLAIEPFAELRIRGECSGQDLDGDGPLESRISGFLDFTHTAGPEWRDDFIRAEAGANGQGHEAG